ncbi:hypothetical protein [Altericista sp. CCNU0014]|uniref:hypothetical protein n=1 Tax=Altericista sp. CCNU0014 TaxID=3082949 RepID=UPI0038500584
MTIGTEVEILHKKKWEIGIIEKVKSDKKPTIYYVRRKDGGKKQREFKHTSDRIRPLQTKTPPLEKGVTSIPPLRESELFSGTIPKFSLETEKSPRSSGRKTPPPPLRLSHPTEEKSVKKQPPPLRTPPESPRQSESFEEVIPEEDFSQPLFWLSQPGLRKTPPREEWSQLLLQQPLFIPPETSKSPVSEKKIPGLRDEPEKFFKTTVKEKSKQNPSKIPAFNRTMRRTPPSEEWESFQPPSWLSQPGLRKTPPPKEWSHFPFSQQPLFIPPETSKSPVSEKKIPGLRDEPDESFETSISLTEEDYVNAVAMQFSEETEKIFRKLWRTASTEGKQQIKTLFSADEKLKNLNNLEYLLEGLDPLHRLEHKGGLEAPARDWLEDVTKLYFFDWLLESAQQKKFEYLKFAGQVDYFDAEKRQNYLLQMGPMVTFVKSKQPLQGEVIYVLSQSDRFYASAGGVSDTDKLIHHSSFLSGQAVKCAGHMTFNSSGQLKTIDVTSGHYKPNQPQMIGALQVLRKQNVPLQNVVAQPSQSEDYSPALELLNSTQNF